MEFTISCVCGNEYDEILIKYHAYYKHNKDKKWGKYTIKIDTLNELAKLGNEINEQLIINFNTHEIIIYNGYIE